MRTLEISCFVSAGEREAAGYSPRIKPGIPRRSEAESDAFDMPGRFESGRAQEPGSLSSIPRREIGSFAWLVRLTRGSRRAPLAPFGPFDARGPRYKIRFPLELEPSDASLVTRRAESETKRGFNT